jgi:hypothetical protein
LFNTTSINKLDVNKFTKHSKINGLYTANKFISVKDCDELLRDFDRYFELAYNEVQEGKSKIKHYDKTNKTAHQVYLKNGAENQTVRATLFTEYHQGSQATKFGRHHALTFPNKIPKFVQPLINKLKIDTYLPKYLFLNHYQLQPNENLNNTLFDWHTDLYVFKKITIICNLMGRGTLQFVPITEAERSRNKDGFQQPSKAKMPEKIVNIDVQEGTIVLLTGPARFNYAHRVIMNTGVERKSLALGMNEANQTAQL